MQNINNLYKITQILNKFDILLKDKTSTKLEIFNPDHVIVSLKQLTKLIHLYFIENKSGFIRIIVQSEMQKIFLDKCVLKLNLSNKIKIFRGIEELKYKKKHSLVIILGNKQNFSKEVQQLFLMKNFLIYNLDNTNINIDFGSYFSSSKIKDIKSLAFIITLIATTIQTIEL